MSRETWTAESALQDCIRYHDGINGELQPALRKALAIVRMHGEIIETLKHVRKDCASIPHSFGLEYTSVRKIDDLLTRAKALEDET